jgi:hypothetical protein
LIDIIFFFLRGCSYFPYQRSHQRRHFRNWSVYAVCCFSVVSVCLSSVVCTSPPLFHSSFSFLISLPFLSFLLSFFFSVIGYNFGPSTVNAGVSFGGFAAPASVQLNDTMVFCTSPAGDGNAVITMTKSPPWDAGVLPPVSFSYDAPNVTSIFPTNLPTTGGILSIYGSNFGPD